MIDLSNIDKYRENNRIEAKRASGGLPKSIWKTYSAFANTLGGIILLGVDKHAGGLLRAVGISNPHALIREFWDTVSNRNKVSVNIMSCKNVTVEIVDGKRIVAIRVPRAVRYDKPVYIGGDPLFGTYRRNGDGDYKCTPEEVSAMLRDSAVKTQDMTVLDSMGLDVFNCDSIRRYRTRMQNNRPGHVWEELEDTDFLYRIGAVGRGEDGKMHPTAAGLLMFGNAYEIVKEYPEYFLDYREQEDCDLRQADPVTASSGERSENIYDFYFRVYNRIIQTAKIPLRIVDGVHIDDTPVHMALREVLANCLVHADYYAGGGVTVHKNHNSITFSNPGHFRTDTEAAICGGVSDPRNSLIMKMFKLINIGGRAGNGLSGIYRVWRRWGWTEPVITESFQPARTEFTLVLGNEETEREERYADLIELIDDAGKISAIAAMQRNMIIEYITDHTKAKTSEIAAHVHLKPSRVRDYINDLVRAGIVTAEGANRNRTYILKR